ncbi:cysteine-rich receptor-like protein kinase 10 [Vicia villosa]|uniref:cysteine-rich receptor-like protein kinase 10 n=1 Tax=Vicia villosa TaxID=3911 RepID=UPI00273A8799|nr:cysteine-rich receptor-like protein kinase 10 [Vicia villosa]
MNSFNLLFLFIFLIINSTTQAQNPTYLFQFCTKNQTNSNSLYHSILKTLFSSLSSNATNNNEFYNTTIPSKNPSNTAYGLFMCRGDVSSPLCQQCVANATQKLSTDTDCSSSKQAVIWYDECMVRYSNTSFFSTVTTSPAFYLVSTANITNQESFMSLLSVTMNESADKAAANSSVGTKKYATKEARISGFQTLYSMAQCTDDLSSQDCSTCLSVAIANLPQCCNGKTGGRVLVPSCNIRYELYPFYRNIAPSPAPSAPPVIVPPTTNSNLGGSSGISLGTIVAIVVPITVAALLFIIGICFLCIRGWKKKHDSAAAQDPKTEIDITTVESLRFDLNTLEEATNKFSEANKLGEGGFGEVYKGVLPSRQQIAVKRLSKQSGQGGEQFKNEVELVAQLQHRNLARLLGFCLEREEKILVYEFVANKSLDYILFDPEKQRLLHWTRRYKIIGGIARGIQYLHEDSRLKIIHRDLKASNILLDGDMNPKISDFGMAKLFGVDQTKGNTSRIVGTYGYMSPEYAMHGNFSSKSDVYSFGVLIMEIISGKKNSSFYETGAAEDLASYAWKLWNNGTPLKLVDHTIRESYTPNEAIRCIHIGLLCVQEDPDDRPTMPTIVLMLDSHTVTLPVPKQPAFFLQSGADQQMPTIQISQSDNN